MFISYMDTHLRAVIAGKLAILTNGCFIQIHCIYYCAHVNVVFRFMGLYVATEIGCTIRQFANCGFLCKIL